MQDQDPMTVYTVRCPNCGTAVNGSDIVGTIALCRSCHRHMVIPHDRIIRNVSYKILHHAPSSADIKEKLLDFFCENGDEKLFSTLTIESISRYYIPVLETKRNGVSVYIPLNDSHTDMFEMFFQNGLMSTSHFEQALPLKDFSDLTPVDYRTAFNTNPDDRIEYLECHSLEKMKTLHGIDLDAGIVIKYLPLTVIESSIGRLCLLGVNDFFILADREKIIEQIRPKERRTIFGFFGILTKYSPHILIVSAVVFLIIMYVKLIAYANWFEIIISIFFYAGICFLAYYAMIYIYMAFLIIFSPAILVINMLSFRVKGNPSRAKGRKVLNISQ